MVIATSVQVIKILFSGKPHCLTADMNGFIAHMRSGFKGYLGSGKGSYVQKK